MKILIAIVCLFNVSGIHAQVKNFDQTAEFIKSKVACCSVPFTASSAARVDSITIQPNGSVVLSYSDKRPKNRFDLFGLYKDSLGDPGIDTILSGKFIQFSVSEKRVRLIRFARKEDTKEVYQAFLQLLELGRSEGRMFRDLNFSQTVDRINIRLAKWAERGNTLKVSALENGDVSILNRRGQAMRLNLFGLKPPGNGNWSGIETVGCDNRSHAPLAWINFKTTNGTTAFIRLKCETPVAELEVMKGAFLHLRSLCKNSSATANPPPGAVHFVSRGAVLTTQNEILLNSLRPTDQKASGDTIISVSSRGEGWLDQDSLPIDQWHFYALNDQGKEYLFKSGLYQRTEPDMFKVEGIDSSDLAKRYHYTFQELQEDHVQRVAFIKSGQWSYFNKDGSTWKTTTFINQGIPITTQIQMMDPDKMDDTRLVILWKDAMDEWKEE